MRSKHFPQTGKLYFHSLSDTNFVIKEIFVENTYLKHSIQVHDGDTIFDIGSNIGLFSIYLTTKYKNLTIHSFEPIPYLFEIFKKNCSIRNIKNVKLNNLAVGRSDSPEEVEFSFYKEISVLSNMYPDDANEVFFKNVLDPEKCISFVKDDYRFVYNTILPLILRNVPFLRTFLTKYIYKRIMTCVKCICKITSLDMYCIKHCIDSIDLLKIDVEGAELDVMLGTSETLFKKVKQIVMEIHDINGRVDTIKKILDRNGFRNIIIEKENDLHAYGWTKLYKLYAKKK